MEGGSEGTCWGLSSTVPSGSTVAFMCISMHVRVPVLSVNTCRT